MKKVLFTMVLITGFISLSFAGSVAVLQNGQNGKRDIIDQNQVQLQLKHVKKDQAGTHMRFNQTFNGVEVWGAQVIKHFDKFNTLTLMNGRVHTDILVGTVPVISQKDASARVAEQLDSSEYEINTAKLVIFPGDNDNYFLTYLVKADKDNSQMRYFIDAENGAVIFSYDNVNYPRPQPVPTVTAAIGTGIGVLGQNVYNLNIGFDGTKYYAKDLVTGGGVETYDMSGSRRLPGTLASDSDSHFTDGAVVDAHKYLETVYNFYFDTFNRKSFNDANALLKASVHYGTNYVNAYWNGSQMVFGDGDGIVSAPLSGALDVIAHELSHAVTQYESDLTYYGESGALNEAFSDIMGACAEFYAQPVGNALLYSDWWMGEDIWYPQEEFGDALRYLDDPNLAYNGYTDSGYDPCHYDERYTGTGDNGGVHINSTIGSHWFYLLADGGTNAYSGLSVSGIGLEDAQQLTYLAYTSYMATNATFSDARVSTLQAAAALFGTNSNQYDTVIEAWNAVGVY